MKNLCLVLLSGFCLCACDPYKYPEESRIALKKDPCFGFCPVYEFEINGKGNATFKGERNVEKEGFWVKKLDPAATNELFRAFESSNFGAFKDEYTDLVTDLPTIWVTFEHGTLKKTVKDYFGAPEALKTLEKRVEAIAETTQGWQKAKDNPGQ